MRPVAYSGMGMDHEWVVDPERVHSHVGHEIEIVTYGGQNLAIECVSCGTVLADIDYWEVPDEGENTTVQGAAAEVAVTDEGDASL